MAQTTEQNEKVEDCMHEPLLIQAVEDSSRDVGYPLPYYPHNGCWRYAVDKRLEGNKHAHSHAYEA